MEELIKSLAVLNMQLLIGPGVPGHFEVRINKLDDQGVVIGSHQQLLPIDDHSYESKVVDCAKFCIDKLLIRLSSDDDE